MNTAIVIAIVALVCTEVCYLVAKRKGLSLPLWVTLGAFFGPIAVIAVLLVKSKKN